MRAPTTSWWWKLTPPGTERARLRLADVVEQRGEPHRELAAGCCARPRSCARARPCGVWIGILLEPHRVELGQELVGEPGLARGATAPRSGRRRAGAATSSSRMRSALTISRRWRHRVDRVDAARAPARSPNAATNRAARSMRSGSSANDTSGAMRRAQHAAPRGRPRRRDGSTSSRLGQRERHGVDREVAPRRGRSSMSSANVTSGLRLSGWYTSPRNVVISMRRPSFWAADRAEALALEPHVVGPAAARCPRRRRGGRRWRGRRRRRRRGRGRRRAPVPPDQVALVPGRDETVGELPGRGAGLEVAARSRAGTSIDHHSRRALCAGSTGVRESARVYVRSVDGRVPWKRATGSGSGSGQRSPSRSSSSSPRSSSS